MYQNEYIISTDLKRKMTSVVPQFVQYDKATLLFKIYDNGVPFPVEDVTEIEVTNVRPDGRAIVGFGVPIQLDDGSWAIRYSYLGSEMKVIGKNKVGLSMFKGKEKVSILPFDVYIIEDLREIAGGEQAEEDAGLLTQLIESVKEVLEEATEILKDANQAIHDVQSVIEDATELGDRLEKEITTSKEATEESIIATENSKNATEEALSVIEISKENSQFALTQGEYAKEQGDFAKNATEEAIVSSTLANEQAEYAKQQGDFAKLTGEETQAISNQATQVIEDMTNLQGQVIILKSETENVRDEANTQATRAKENADLAEPLIQQMQSVLPNVTGLENKGEYSFTVTYDKNNIVSFNGSSYMSLSDNNQGNLVTDITKWHLIAQRGVDGKGAVASVNGIQPNLDGDVLLGKLLTLTEDNTTETEIKSPMQNLDDANLKNIIISDMFPAGNYAEGTILIKRSDIDG